MATARMGVTIVPRIMLNLTRFDPTGRIHSIGNPPLNWETCAVYRKGAYLESAERVFIRMASQVMQPYSELLERKRYD